MAVRYKDSPKLVLSIVGEIQVSLLVCVGLSMRFGARYIFCVGVGGGFVLSWLISNINLDDPAKCLWWFKHGSHMMGSIIVDALFCRVHGLRHCVIWGAQLPRHARRASLKTQMSIALLF